MRDIPVFCDTCGTPFRSGISAGNITITVGSYSAGPCPTCGGRGTLSNVVLTITQDAIRILGNGSAGAAEMERLRTLIERAQQREVPPAELVAELEQGDSTLKGLGALLSQLLVPKDAGQFYGLLALLLAAWPLLQQPKEELTPAKITTIVETAVQQTLNKAQASALPAARPHETPQVTNPAKKKKIGRNDPCPCPSGKKYKHCCGSLAGR